VPSLLFRAVVCEVKRGKILPTFFFPLFTFSVVSPPPVSLIRRSIGDRCPRLSFFSSIAIFPPWMAELANGKRKGGVLKPPDSPFPPFLQIFFFLFFFPSPRTKSERLFEEEFPCSSPPFLGRAIDFPSRSPKRISGFPLFCWNSPLSPFHF